LADQVEISNVGGNDGVASEATLASLAAALQKIAAKSGMDPASQEAKLKKIANKATEDGITITNKNTKAELENTKVTKEATGATAQFAKTIADASLGAIGDIVGSIVNFGMELAFGGNRLSDFAGSIPLFGQFLGPLAGMIDNNVDQFRDLSKVGATFGTGLVGLQQAAAEAGMPLNEFSQLIQDNAMIMKTFGGDVASGSLVFSKMAKELRDGPGRELMNIGFTSGELNDLLISYQELQTRQFTGDRIRNRVTAQSAAEFGEQLQKLSTATGQQREQILEAMEAQRDDVRIGAARSRMSAEEFERFSANIGTVSGVSKGLADALVDFDDGIPTNDSTRRLMQMSDTFRNFGDEVENMSPGELNNFMVEVRKDLEERAAQMGVSVEEMMSRIPGLSGMLDIIGDTSNLKLMTEEEIKAAAARAAAEKTRNENLKQFDETIASARAKLVDAFITSGAMDALMDGADGFAKAVKVFTEGDTFKNTLDALSASFKTMLDRVKTFVEDIGKYNLKTALFGGKAGDVIGQDEQGNDITLQEDVKGLFGDIFAGAAESAGTIGTFVADGVKSVIGGLFDSFDITWDDIFVGGIAGLGLLIAAPIIGIPGALAAAVLAVIGKDKLIELWTETWDTIKGFFSFGTGEDAASYSIGNLASAAWETVTGWFGFTGEEATYGISNLASAAWETVTGWFTMDSEGNYSILDIANNVWTSVTGWFSLADTKFSITEDLTTMWNTVTGWFGIDGTTYSVSQLASDAWDVIKGYFTFGENAPAFSIQNLAQTAWDTVTGFFSLENFEVPSISSMFQSIIDAVKGFFTFDFEMPNFKQYLPTWLGGEGKSLFGNDNTVSAQASIDATPAVEGAESLMDTQSAIATFANIENLQNNLDILKNGLDVDNVRSYTEAMENLVEVLAQLNEELKSSQNSRGRGREAQNAASVISKMDSIGGGASSEELTKAITQLATLMSQNVTFTKQVALNTKYGNTTDISRQLPS